jgi:glutamate carboxypeptidase
MLKSTKVSGTTAKIQGGVDHPPIEKDLHSEMFIDLVKECGRSLGLNLKEKFCWGASDGGFTSDAGTVTIDGLQPLGALYHTADEYLDLTTVIPRISLTALVIREVSLNQRFWIRSQA